MTYRIQFSATSDEDILLWKRSGQAKGMQKISKLLKEIELHPRSGSGKPELLRHEFSGWWSRRIDSRHRIVYEIDDMQHIVVIHSLWGHYTDK